MKLNYGILLLFILVVHPANYLVRLAFDKYEPSPAKKATLPILHKSSDHRSASPLEAAATSNEEGELVVNEGEK